MANGNPQDKIFNLPWPNAMEYIIGVTAWSPEECIVVTNHAVYRVDTPFNGHVNVRPIAGRY
jgi:hypothetical protein